MKKTLILISIILTILINLILTSAVQAANPKAIVTIEADKTQIMAGDEITYTISIETTEEISTLDLILDIPTGLTLVDDSKTIVDSDLTNDTITKKFFNDEIVIVRMDTITLNGKVTLATFKCKADTSANGDYKVGFKLVEITVGDDDDIIPDNEYSIMNKSTINVKDTIQETEKNEEKKSEKSENSENKNLKENKSKKTPKTGDNSNMILWVTLCIITAICFIVIARWNTKKSK